MGTGHHKTGFFILYFSEDLSESWGCSGRSWMIFHPLFFYLGWIWKNKIEVTASRPESESSENVRLHKCERALVQANPVPTFPLDFKPACDINTRRRHCSICWLRLEFKALALTCEIWNVLESLAWDIISFLCHVAIHEITRDAQSCRALGASQIPTENLALQRSSDPELAPCLRAPLHQTFIPFTKPAKKVVSWGVFVSFVEFLTFLYAGF